MSAEILRRAAALMRERAEAATPGPWLQEGAAYGHPSRNVRAQHQDGWPLQGIAYGVGRTADAAHIASWHPAVALAVADWLEETATDWDKGPCDAVGHPCNHCEYHPADLAALNVARAYLGESA